MSKDGNQYAAPAFQLYARKWLDFRIARLALFDQGVLAKLQAFMWAGSEDQCSVPDEDKETARALGITVRRWRGVKERLLQEPKPLIVERDGRLVSPYLQKQAKRQRIRREKLSEGGKKGAEKRWAGQHEANRQDSREASGEANGPANGEATEGPMAGGMANDSLSSSSSSSSSPDHPSDGPHDTAPSGGAAASEPDEDVVFTFPPEALVSNDGAPWHVTESHYDRLVEAHPGVDVRRELTKALDWLLANLPRRKTPNGMPRFIGGWMERAQNSGRERRRPDKPEKPKVPPI